MSLLGARHASDIIFDSSFCLQSMQGRNRLQCRILPRIDLDKDGPLLMPSIGRRHGPELVVTCLKGGGLRQGVNHNQFRFFIP